MKLQWLAAALAIAMPAGADVLIRDATVHTATSSGVLEHQDVLIRDGRVAELGAGLAAPAGAEVIEAGGRPLTPGFFGGFTQLGLREISYEPGSVDDSLSLESMHPEFDVSLAFNPDSAAIGVSATEGITFAMIAPTAGASIVAGQAGLAFFDGRPPTSHRALVIDLGADASTFSGGSRAAQFMLLRQAISEARQRPKLLAGDRRLLTAAGRSALRHFADGRGLVVFDVDRASDIRLVIELVREERLRAAVAGGAEAWRVASSLAAAAIPVILDPLANMPSDFDRIGATLENAARLHKVGVTIAFSFFRDEPIRTPRLRQGAGNAIANGLPAEAALAAMTRGPAEIFGVAESIGTVEVGKLADLVLWSGDPFEVTTYAERVFAGGKALDMTSRETELRDRYLPKSLPSGSGAGQ